ncbi:TPR repeat-containing protein [Cryptosporidium muris RN66]|uniref:TPR repeat-containing protein n=1 Tax=Cryptosporidium muris (strain RN66) TaxID=441375 RepID=B6AEF6_CRYMR|nr:TPR repeat-containing protein [Cryptosporidium muris RN66]EEA06573.1 TPR repeat-containing protein [Cryptosporidium muris RN66]|eukprot:XP_002140922.1 TPR repeat-containing protein [Cryptosporidium muris RN66]
MDITSSNIYDYIDSCKNSGNYSQCIFWCDVLFSLELNQASENSKNNLKYNYDKKNKNDHLDILLDENHCKIYKSNDSKTTKYLLNMASLYMLDKQYLAAYSILHNIDNNEVNNEDDIETFNGEISNSAEKLYLEAQYLYSVHQYEECLSLIESSMDLSNYDPLTSSTIHTMAADAFISIGNIEHSILLYETALYESIYAIEALEYLLFLPYCSDNKKYSIVSNLINMPIESIDKNWISKYIHPYTILTNKITSPRSLMTSRASSPTRKKEKRLLPTSPIGVSSKISMNNNYIQILKNTYSILTSQKTINDFQILTNIAQQGYSEFGLKIATLYISRFITSHNLNSAYITGYKLWNILFKDQNDLNLCDISTIFNSKYNYFELSSNTLCNFIQIFGICIISKIYTEASIYRYKSIGEDNEYLALLEAFLIMLRKSGGEVETIRKACKDGNLVFSIKLANAKYYARNADDINYGANFCGITSSNTSNFGSSENNLLSIKDTWHKKIFPSNNIASTYLFIKGCYLFSCAIKNIKLGKTEMAQDIKSMLRTSMYCLKRSIHFNFLIFPSYYLWGNIYATLGQWDDAMAIFRRMVRLFPSANLSITSTISLLLQRINLEKELKTNELINQCISWANKAILINKNFPIIQNSLGLCSYYEEKYDIAIGYFQRALIYLINNYNTDSDHHFISEVLLQDHNYSLNYNSTLYISNPLSYIITINLSISYLMGGHYGNAIDCLESLSINNRYLHPVIAEIDILQNIYISLAISHHLLGNIKEAYHYYQQCLSLPYEQEILDYNINNHDINDHHQNNDIESTLLGTKTKQHTATILRYIYQLYDSIISEDII